MARLSAIFIVAVALVACGPQGRRSGGGGGGLGGGGAGGGADGDGDGQAQGGDDSGGDDPVDNQGGLERVGDDEPADEPPGGEDGGDDNQGGPGPEGPDSCENIRTCVSNCADGDDGCVDRCIGRQTPVQLHAAHRHIGISRVNQVRTILQVARVLGGFAIDDSRIGSTDNITIGFTCDLDQQTLHRTTELVKLDCIVHDLASSVSRQRLEVADEVARS